MGEEESKFFMNVSYVSVGMAIGSILAFVFNILIGRMLTPAGYGEFTLIYSVAMFLYIPMLQGYTTSMVKYNAEKDHFKRQTIIISNTYLLVILSTILSIIVFYLFSSVFANIFSISVNFFHLAILFATLFVFFTLTTNTLRSLHKMKTFALLTPLFGFIVLMSFLLFVYLKYGTFESALYSTYIGYGIVSLIIIIRLRDYFLLDIDRYWIKRITKYGSFAMIGGMSFIFYTNIDKILIYKYLGVFDVGIYRAYSIASINIIGILFGVFNTVFFPTASKHKNKVAILKRINKIIPYLILIGLPLIFLLEYIILIMFGSDYKIDLILLVLFGVAALIIFINGCYVWLIASIGIDGIKVTSIGAVIAALINTILNIISIPAIGLYGAIISTIISYIIFTLIISQKLSLLQNTYSSEVL